MAEKNDSTIITEPMDESLEFIFNSMMQQGEVAEAIDFIRSIGYKYIPSETIIRTIIFQVLMKSEDTRCLAMASAYLVNVLDIFLPNTTERREFYFHSIREVHGYLSHLWNVFSHIINSYYCHYEIYIIENGVVMADVINYPNCKFLLDFYVKLLSVDFEYSDSYKTLLIMHLLWPHSDICRNTRTENLFKWINDIYSSPMINRWADLLASIHEILTLMVKSIIQAKHNLLEVTALNHSCMTEIVDDISNFCKNAFSTLPMVKLFLSSIPIRSLQARVAEKIIKMILKQASKPFSVLTLKEIVNQHMFPKKFNKWKNPKPTTNKEKALRKRTSDKSSEKRTEATKLHELCKTNKFADLMMALKSSYDLINVRDQLGATPLYEACQASSYMCVRILVREAGKPPVPKLDYIAADNDGCTPLHLAVRMNSLEIARSLLVNGGSDLLNVIDNKGNRPADLDCSEEMEKLLQEFQPDTPSNELGSFIEDSQIKEAPTLKSFRDYSIYLHALNCLLCNYSDLFQLNNLITKKTTFVQNHAEKMCCHFVNDEYACSEDAALLPEMPDLIESFTQSLKKNVSKSSVNFNIDIELLPLRAYKASLLSNSSL